VPAQSAPTIRRDVVWPPRIIRPQRPPSAVYLDLNHYINMAKVIAGKAVDGYADLLASARQAVADGRALFVLSATHLMEVTAIKDPRQRSNIADVMAELSGFTYMLGRPLIEKLEVEGSLAELLGPDIIDLKAIGLLGFGASYPFGEVMSWSPEGEGNAALERIRAQAGSKAADQFVADFRRGAELHLLHGGDSGHPIGNWRSMLENRAIREVGQAALIDADPNYPMEKLRAVVSAGELLVELNEMVSVRLAESGRTLKEVLPTPEVAFAFTDGMPSTRVAISMKTHYFKNAANRWTTNDVSDIDALSVAVAYCDAVYSDKKAMHAVKSSHELGVFNTFIPRKPLEMADWIDRLPAPRSD
jgi:hypothetical protein